MKRLPPRVSSLNHESFIGNFFAMNHFGSERTVMRSNDGKAGGWEVEMKFTRPWILAGLLLTAPGAQAQLLPAPGGALGQVRSEQHTSELQSLMRISYAVFCLKKQIQ